MNLVGKDVVLTAVVARMRAATTDGAMCQQPTCRCNEQQQWTAAMGNDNSHADTPESRADAGWSGIDERLDELPLGDSYSCGMTAWFTQLGGKLFVMC